jgi:putative sigma-54 modulation protein
MPVELTGRNVTVTTALKKLAQKGIERLERHLAGSAEVRIVVWREKHLFKAEVIATHGRRRWTAREERDDLEAAVAFSLETIDARARKDAERRRDRKHRGAQAGAGNGRGRSSEGRSPGGARGLRGPRSSDSRIVRAGRLPIKPMSVEEAALSMDDSGREFLVFRDAASERVSVLYKRRDGDLGLIVPEEA